MKFAILEIEVYFKAKNKSYYENGIEKLKSGEKTGECIALEVN